MGQGFRGDLELRHRERHIISQVAGAVINKPEVSVTMTCHVNLRHKNKLAKKKKSEIDA